MTLPNAEMSAPKRRKIEKDDDTPEESSDEVTHANTQENDESVPEREENIDKLVKLASAAVNNKSLEFDHKELHIDDPEEYARLLKEFYGNCMNSPAYNACRPAMTFSYPIFNFQLAGKPKATITTSRGNDSQFGKHIAADFFYRIGDLDDSDREAEFQSFISEWNNLPEYDKNLCAMSSILSWRSDPITDNSYEVGLVYSFSENALKRLVTFMQYTAPLLSVKRLLPGRDVLDGPVVPISKALRPDLALVETEGDGTLYPLAIFEMKTVPIHRTPMCCDWSFYNEFGVRRPDFPEPGKDEITKCTSIMKEALECCFSFGFEEVVISDGLCMILLKFDLKGARRYRDMTEARKKWRGDLADKYGPFDIDAAAPTNHRREVPGPIGVIGYRSKVIWCDGSMPTMRKQIAMMIWQEHKLRGTAAVAERHQLVVNSFKNIKLTLAEFMAKEEADTKDVSDQLGGLSVENGSQAPSSTAKHTSHLEYSPIQDDGHVNKVVRMSMDDCAKVFPKVRRLEGCDSVVVKVLDFSNVELYYDEQGEDEMGDWTCDEFKQRCMQRYVNEVECYMRIAKHNRESSEEIYTPELLDYGLCCIHDDEGNYLEGCYLILEDLKGTRPTEYDLSSQIKRLASIGIVHGDIADRNVVEVDGRIYLIDFNFAKLVRVKGIKNVAEVAVC